MEIYKKFYAVCNRLVGDPFSLVARQEQMMREQSRHGFEPFFFQPSFFIYFYLGKFSIFGTCRKE